MTVHAHVGHWLVQLLYAAPVLVLLGFIVVGQIKTRRERRQDADERPDDEG